LSLYCCTCRPKLVSMLVPDAVLKIFCIFVTIESSTLSDGQKG
jgi:hypothetical protein